MIMVDKKILREMSQDVLVIPFTEEMADKLDKFCRIQPNTTLPVITRPQKKYLFLVVPGFIACTILIVWIYNTILVWLDIPINHVGAIIGNITSAIIATLSAIYFIKPKS